jgi:hypothetical protein
MMKLIDCHFSYIAFDPNAYKVVCYGNNLVYVKKYIEDYLNNNPNSQVLVVDIRNNGLILYKYTYKIDFIEEGESDES